VIRSPLFWRIAAGLTAVIALTAVISILLVTPRAERAAMARIEDSLLSRAIFLEDIARPMLERGPDAESEEAFQARIRALGEATETRLTVIDASGRVVADSLGRDATMADPHRNRPEIVEARESGDVGTSSRHSRTTGLDLRYLARVVRDEHGTIVGYVRTALPTASIEEQNHAIWGRTALGAALAGLLGLAAGLFLTHRLTRRLSVMADAARAIAEGKHPEALPTRPRDETGALARALQRMHEQLEERHAALVQERNELAGILASMREGVVAVDRDLRVVQMNRVAGALLHVDVGGAVGTHVVDTVRVAEVCEILETVIRENERHTREVHLVEQRATRILELYATPLLGSADGPAGAVLVLHDVTELRRLEAVRRDFVANVSHELKTPLAAMQGLIETVLEDEDMDAGTQQEFLRRALGQSGRLTALVKDLLVLSRIESEPGLAERRRLDLRRPLREAAERLEPVVRRAELRLETELPEEPLIVFGDEEGIRQIVDNLLDNARKYTAPGGQVRLRLWREGDDAVVEVTDTGMGIEPEHLGRIFERFYRVDKARSRSLGGTGLGLSIVRHLVQAHGGRVEVESTPGEGSCFRVRLPLAEAAPGNGGAAPRA